MAKRSKRAAILDLGEVLNRPVRVRRGDDIITMTPFEAEVRQCVHDALKGNIRACGKFIRLCIKVGLLARAEDDDGHQYRLEVPKDWDWDEFVAVFRARGFPPWPGPRDGLTVAERERRNGRRARRG